MIGVVSGGQAVSRCHFFTRRVKLLASWVGCQTYTSVPLNERKSKLADLCRISSKYAGRPVQTG